MQRLGEADLVPGQNVDRLTCPICCEIFLDPVFAEGLCQCVFCRDCIQQSLQVRPTCPICQTFIHPHVLKPHLWVRTSLDDLHVKCPSECGWTGRNDAKNGHLQNCAMHHLKEKLDDANRQLEANKAEQVDFYERMERMQQRLDKLTQAYEAKRTLGEQLEARAASFKRRLARLQESAANRASSSSQSQHQSQSQSQQAPPWKQMAAPRPSSAQHLQQATPPPHDNGWRAAHSSMETPRQAKRQRVEASSSSGARAEPPPFRALPQALRDRNNQIFLEAAKKGNWRVVQGMLAEGAADITASDRCGTVLHNAVFGKVTPDMLKFLLAHGADVDAYSPDGHTPLQKATINGIGERLVNVFLEAGSNIHLRARTGGETVLHLAATNGGRNLMDTLIKAGADVNVKTPNGSTPLQRATNCGSLALVTLLISKGARVNDQNRDGDTALHFAVRSGRTEVTKYLVGKANADVNIVNQRNESPLSLARLVPDPANRVALTSFLGNYVNVRVKQER